MAEKNFEIRGKKFQLSKIDAFKQFHIVRRIGPILADVLPAMKDAEKFKDESALAGLSEKEKFDMVAGIAAPVMTGLSKLSDADAELVLYGLLSAVEVQQPTGNWAKVASNSMLMVQDLELPILMQLAGRAFVYNLSGFFAGLPQ